MKEKRRIYDKGNVGRVPDDVQKFFEVNLRNFRTEQQLRREEEKAIERKERKRIKKERRKMEKAAAKEKEQKEGPIQLEIEKDGEANQEMGAEEINPEIVIE